MLRIVRRSRHDADLREEMETHRSLRQETLEREGVATADAIAASRRALGNVALAREDAREVWLTPAIEGIWQDMRGALRSSRRSATSSVTIVVTLVFGLGLASAIFAFGDGYLARPLPFPDGEQLYVVPSALSADEINGLRASSLGPLGFVEGSAAPVVSWAGRLELDGRQVETFVAGLDDGFAQTMGVPLVMGRSFGPDDYRGAVPVPVWLSHRFWQREFGGDPSILNRTLSFRSAFDRSEVTSLVIIGVTDPRITTFDPDFGANMSLPDLFAPAAPRTSSDRAKPIVRLPHDMSPEHAEAAISAALQNISPAPDGGTRGIRLDSLRQTLAGDGRPTAMLFFAGAVLALVLVTVNLVHLLLARGVARAGEIATRSALGASRWRIARMLLFESLLYGAAGIGGGLLVGRWLANAIAAGVPERGSDSNNLALVAMTFDLRAVAFAIVAGVAVIAVGTMWPIKRVAFASPGSNAPLNRRNGARISARFSRLILTCEVAISTVILMGIVFVGFGMWRYVNQPLGFHLEDRFSLSFPASSGGHDEGIDWPAVLDAVRAVPGVRSASVDRVDLLRASLRSGDIDLSGRDVAVIRATSSWLETRGVDLVQGRLMDAAEIESNAPVAVVDVKFASAVWPGEGPVGKTIRSDTEAERVVVGVVSHQRFSLARENPGLAYVPQPRVDGRQAIRLWAPDLTTADIVTRTAGPLQALAPGYSPVVRAVTFETTFRDDLSYARFQRPIIIALGLFAVTLAVVGLFGLVAYLVEQRTRDFGIRLALGASRGEVLKEVVWQSALPGVAGLVIGLCASWTLEGAVRATMSGWESSGPMTMAIVSIVVLVAVVLAAVGPARRILRIDPAVVLRAE